MRATRIEIWHRSGSASFNWGSAYSWATVFELLPPDAWRMRWSINTAIRPRCIQLMLWSPVAASVATEVPPPQTEEQS